MWSIITKVFNIIFAWKQEENVGKNPFYSKTIWTLIISWLALVLSKYVGIELSAEEQLTILTFIGIILRFITKKPIGFWETKGG
jgi:hypothetical protein